MKFTKEEANKELVARMTAKGEKLNLSQRSIDEQIEALLPLIANDEMEVSVFVSSILPIIKTADANVRNDVSQGIKDYKDANPIETPKPSAKPKEGDVNKELLERLEALEKKNKDAEIALKHQGIKNSLTSKMKELGVKNNKWIEAMVGNVSVTDDMDIDAKAKEYLELYNSIISDVDPNLTPGSSGGGKPDYTVNAIKEAAKIAKANNLVG